MTITDFVEVLDQSGWSLQPYEPYPVGEYTCLSVHLGSGIGQDGCRVLNDTLAYANDMNDIKDIRRIFENCRTVSLGVLGFIVYWPNIPYAAETED